MNVRCRVVSSVVLILLVIGLVVACTLSQDNEPVLAPPPPPAQPVAPKPEPPVVVTSQKSLNFDVQHGDVNVFTKMLNISNSGGGTLEWEAWCDTEWLMLSPERGSLTTDTEEVTVAVGIGGVPVGEYTARINVSAPGSSNTPDTVIVTISVVENPQYVYDHGFPIIRGDGVPIRMMNKPDARNPTYDELVSFIEQDETDAQKYKEYGPNAYVCTDFAEDLHNRAEEAGLKAALVAIVFRGSDEGHALNAFETPDEGLVYVDCTQRDTIAYVEVGKEYGTIDIALVESLSYSFYEEYQMEWQHYGELLDEYDEQVTQFNQEVTEYEEALDDYNDEVEAYNNAYSRYAKFISDPPGSPWHDYAEGIEIQFAIEYGRNFEREREYLEEQGEALQEQRDQLEQWSEDLEDMSYELDELNERLGDSYFQPMGVVEEVSILW